MGVEKISEVPPNRAIKSNTVNIYRPPALRRTLPISQTDSFEEKIKESLISPTRITTTSTTSINTIATTNNSTNTNSTFPDTGTIEATTNTKETQNNGNSNNILTDNNVQLNSNQNNRQVRRVRRPDRAVYVPRARRSQTTPPLLSAAQCSSAENSQQTVTEKNSNRNNCSSQSKIKSNSFESDCIESNDTKENATDESIILKGSNEAVIYNCDNDKVSIEINNTDATHNSNDITTNQNDPMINHECDNLIQTETQNIKNVQSTNLLNHYQIAMNQNDEMTESNSISKNLIGPRVPFDLRIEDVGKPQIKDECQEDTEIKELEKASREINRTSRRIIKQTFNSDVLEIPDNIPSKTQAKQEILSPPKKVDPENDDWDSMYDDNGDCIDPRVIAELTTSVGKVKIEQPKSDYKAYHVKQAILNDEEFPHVLEVSNFPIEFKTHDLLMLFSAYKESGFEIKWVDDTHALAVFSSSKIAAEALTTGHPFVLLKPLAEATVESRTKARKCSSSLQPYRPRPETCAALARRLVTGALGVRLKTAPEERENEKRVLREAKERKLLAAKQRDEIWES